MRLIRQLQHSLPTTVLLLVISGFAVAYAATGSLILGALSGLAFGMAAYGAREPAAGIVLFFVWVPFVDFAKRLLWLNPGANPPDLYVWWVLALPDVILIAVAARLAYDHLVARSRQYVFDWIDLIALAFLGWSAATILHPNNSLLVGLAGFKSSSIYVLIYFIVKGLSSQESVLRKKLFNVVMYSAIVVSFYTLFQGTYGLLPFEQRWLESSATAVNKWLVLWKGILRPFSTMALHEQVGFFLGFAILIALFRSKYSMLSYGLLILLILAEMRTISRQAWAFLAVAITISFVLATVLGRSERDLPRRLIIAVGMMIGSFGIWFLLLSNDSSSDVEGSGYAAQASKADSEELGSAASATTPDIEGSNNAAQASKADSEELGSAASATTPDIEGSNYAARALTIESYGPRIETYQTFLSDPEFRRLFGNRVGARGPKWRFLI